MAPRRLMRRVVGREVRVGVGLTRHHREVQGAIPQDHAILELCIRGHAGRSQAHVPVRRGNRGAPCALEPRLLPHLELAGHFCPRVGTLE